MRLPACVHPLMSSSPTLLTEFLVAELAGERLLAGVYPLMGDALAVVPELLRAVLAAVLVRIVA